MSAARTLLAAGSLALCVGGLATMGRGVEVPFEASRAQVGLEQVFERRLAAPKTHIGDGLAAVGQKEITVKARKSAIAPTIGPLMRISVERLGIRQIVLAGDPTHDRLAKGPAVIKAPSPESPVTVLAAHRDTHFLFVRDLKEGDEITLEQETGAIERYRVTGFQTIRWDAFAYPLDPARPLLALTTCYPFGGTEYGGTWRRVAWAERLDSSNGSPPSDR